LNASVLFVAAEAMPLAKTGGLGDVVSGLARSLQERGLNVTILMPGYPQALAAATDLRSFGAVHLDDTTTGPGLALPPCHTTMRLMVGRLPGSAVQVALLDCPSLFDRAGTPYTDPTGRDFADNAQRFAALAHAAVAIAAGRTALPVPQAVHAHDWHAGLTPLLMKAHGISTPSFFTIHNMAFQGLFPLSLGPALGVPDAWLGPDGAEFWGQLNFLKAGIRYADRVTTVSDTYAKEILTPAFGHGLEGLLRARQDVLGAIPNGVDTETWDPSRDTLLPQRYTISSVAGKRACKAELQRRFGLPVDPFAPVVAMGSRLTHQKMADVALPAIERILAARPNVQFIVLGCGDPLLEHGFMSLAAAHPERVGVSIGYSEEAAHLLHAGSDLLLHGSRFEPFGLTPLYAMRYGTVPIVSRVGGMVDTVTDAGEGPTPAPGATGFIFDGDHVDDMTRAIERALQWFGRNREWRAMQRAGMQSRWDWEGPAAQYLSLYGALAPRIAAEAELAAAKAAAEAAVVPARRAPRRATASGTRSGARAARTGTLPVGEALPAAAV
jgi:starch synthase